ncbi:hypothetical protein FA13DRAFT_1798842 [Coprinellus micaceus]|uniref:Uncharacterized protein n=1 Tax=Coprinellus micaceus TaxID=71717 RepID=A0A4Y7SL37_COPMI|nr:hypothetical protein FA13DRAFT_1798842 [Coprinellus micaceus]
MATPMQNRLMPTHLSSPPSSPTPTRTARSSTNVTPSNLAGRSSRASHSVPDAAGSDATPTLASLADAIRGLAADLATVKSDLRKSLTEQGVLMAQLDQLSTAYAESLSMTHRLYELVLTLTPGTQPLDTPESSNVATTPPSSPELPAQARLPERRRPPFHEDSDMFYVMIKGRCPGFYTSLPWVQSVLIDNQNSWENIWKGFPTLERAIRYWKDNQDLIKFTGRTDGDEHLYGPHDIYIPF